MHIVATGLTGGIGQAFRNRVRQHQGWTLTGLVRRPQWPGDRLFDVTWSRHYMQASLEGLPAADALVLLHGADILSPPWRQVAYDKRLEHLIDVDIRGTVRTLQVSQAFLKKDATLIFMGWDQIDGGVAGESGELYGLAKAAIVGYAQSLARSWRGRVVVVAPGWVQTRWAGNLSDAARDHLSGRSRDGRWQTSDEVALTLEEVLVKPDVTSGSVVTVGSCGLDMTRYVEFRK